MLDCPIQLEFYQYEIGDEVIVLDVQSSSFFTVDKLTSEILELADEYLTKDIIAILNEDYLKEDIIDRLNYLEELWADKKLNPPDSKKSTIDSFYEYKLKLHPTSKCNLNCEYCFGDEVYSNGRNNISFEVAKDAIDFLVYEFGADGGSYNVDLTGSAEPLLRFEFIKKIKQYCENLSEEIDKRILVSLCTNGTLLDKEKSSYLKQNRMLYGISIDGGQLVHNDLRSYQNGKNTYQDIIKNCQAIEDKKYLGFAVTLTGKHTKVKDIFLDLFNLDLAETISIKPIRLTPDSEYAINENNIDEIKDGYNELVLFLIEETIQGNVEYLYAIIKGADYFGKFLKRTIRNDRVIYRCSAGLSNFSVNHKGEIYSCAVELNNEAFKMGDIYSGIDKKEQQRLSLLYADNIDYCKGCWARYLCSGECFAMGYQIHQKMEQPYRVMCEYRKHLIRLSMYLWTKIREDNPGIFDAIAREAKERKW